MWRYTDLKDTRDPFNFGTLIKRAIKCGKDGCKCINKEHRHTAYYLRWRDKDIFTGKVTVRQKYIKKSEVESVGTRLHILKGRYIYTHLNLSQLDYAWLFVPKGSPSDDYALMVYSLFSKHPYPLFPDDPINKMLKADKKYLRKLKYLSAVKYGKPSRAEYLRNWRQSKKSEMV